MAEPSDKIRGLLEDLAAVAAYRKKKVVVFLDEFQDVGEADISDEFQLLLRDFAQYNKDITFIVSGSNRRLLESMFDDRNKPLYKLFDKMYIQRC